jgi:hypothetical protein
MRQSNRKRSKYSKLTLLIVAETPFVLVRLVVVAANAALAILVQAGHLQPCLAAVEPNGDGRQLDDQVCLLGVVEVNCLGLAFGEHWAAVFFANQLL